MQDEQKFIREVLKRYRNGDADALSDLVERYRRPLYGYILRMTEGRDDAEEIFQEVWFRAIRKLPTYRHDKLLSWLFRIAHNLVIDRARKKKPDQSLDENSEDGFPLGDRVADSGASPDRQTERSDLSEKIRQEVDRLPPDQKEVFIMRTEADLSFKIIASIQSVSLNTALGRMHYAVNRLREALASDYADWKGELG